MTEGYLTAQSTLPLKVRGMAGMSAHVRQYALASQIICLGVVNQTTSILSVYSVNIPYMIHMVYFTVYSL
jgi:hypothetical protein